MEVPWAREGCSPPFLGSEAVDVEVERVLGVLGVSGVLGLVEGVGTDRLVEADGVIGSVPSCVVAAT